MCKPVYTAKPELHKESTTIERGQQPSSEIRLSTSLFILPICIFLIVLSFLAGCFVRVLNLPVMHNGSNHEMVAKVSSEECPNDSWSIQEIDASININRINNEIMARAQHLIIEVNTQKDTNESALKSIMNTLEQAMRDLSANPLRTSHRCNHSHCLTVSLEGHIVIHSIRQMLLIDVFLRDYDYSAQYQQHRMQCILNSASTLGSIKWSHKLRGFLESPYYVRLSNPLDHEMGADLLRRMDDKKLLVSRKTKYQTVDIYELPRRRFNGDALISKQLEYPDGLLGKDKALYLDGVLQSSLYGDAIYHEALVHPGMIVHANPKRVAIIGGGEGATLREVLKHTTVENVVMLEIDEELTMISREYLSEWNDCNDISTETVNSIIGKSSSCFDEEKVDLHFVDAFQWFVDNYNQSKVISANENTRPEKELFDVIIMDALDPDDFVVFAEKLYNNTDFIESLYNGLSFEGVFVVQLGESPENVDPSDEFGPFRNRAKMTAQLQKFGFESIHVFDEGHCDFFHPWTILVALKNYESRSNWYRNAAEIQIELIERIVQTKSGNPALLHFDAATMISYQIPSKSFESIYCRQDDEPEECDDYYGFWPDINNIPISHVQVKKSGVSEQAGRGIFAVNDIPKDSMIDLGQGTKAFHMAPTTWDVFDTLYDWVEEKSEREVIASEMSGLKYFIEG